jgi:HEPN domain-containing protein
MAPPQDPDARKYYRAAIQRLSEAEIILTKAELPSPAIYLAGYAVECMLKALILARTQVNHRAEARRRLREDLGHNLRRLRDEAGVRGANPPVIVTSGLLFVSSWSPALRYEPGPAQMSDARRFLAATRSVVVWAERSI